MPQDGRFRLKIAGRDYDVRLSTVPGAHGERLVMRLLPDTQDLLDLAKIGFNPVQLAALDRIIRRPNGIFLVTGPTGSGKTTQVPQFCVEAGYSEGGLLVACTQVTSLTEWGKKNGSMQQPSHIEKV